MRRVSVLAAVLATVLPATALLVGPAGSSPAPAAASKPAKYKFLKAQVFTAPGLGEIAVGMPNPRVVKVQHRTGGGTWSRPMVLFRKPGITCGQIDGRASAGGVALLLECDSPYYEDQAPVHSRAFVTRDLVSWKSNWLRGEAYQDPAISADGSHAAWLYGDHGHYRLWSAATGFSDGQTGFDYDSGDETIVVDGAGTVTVMGADGTGDGCELGVWDKPLTGPEDHYVIDGADVGCTEGGVDNVNEGTVVGDASYRPERFYVTREPGERWALTRGAPVDEPSLVRYSGSKKKVIRNFFSDATGQALISLGSPDRKHIYAQAYDDATGTWGSSALVYTDRAARCRDRGYFGYEPFARVHAVPLTCARRRLLLTSSDSTTWTTTQIDERQIAISGSGRLLAAAGPRSIVVVSPAGTETLRRTALGRCDFVFPIATDSVLRLHAGKAARWPTRLQKSVGGGPWKTIQRVRMPNRGTCAKVHSQHDLLPSMFFLRGDGQFVSLRVKRGGRGGWHVERFDY